MNTDNSQQSLYEEIRSLIQEALGNSTHAFSDDDSLVLSGQLSSLQVVDLAVKLEQRYQLDFSSNGFNQYDFDSVNNIVQLIENHHSG